MTLRPLKLDPRKQAIALLSKLNITRAPIPVERIARHLGTELRFSPLDDEISGMVYIKDAIPIIGINSLHHPNRQRFSIAHELGHLVLHRHLVEKEVHVDKDFHVLRRDKKASAGTDEIEIEANRFASELLMPKAFLEQILVETKFDVDDEKFIESLAARFKVSKQAMGHRVSALLDLGGL